jgi:hypothetical protein
MNRTLSNLGPSLFLAAAILVASALTVAAPHASWAAVAGPLLLVLALVGTDVALRRRSGRGTRPSASVLLLAASLVVACGIVASNGPDRLAGMILILGSGAAVPVVLRQGARPSCRRA